MKWLLLVCFGITNVQADVLRDPTQPNPNKSMLDSAQDPQMLSDMALKLTAIIHNKDYKQAIINGRSFAEGQQVLGYKVVLISQNHVELVGSDGKQMLYVNNNNIKKDANNGF